MRDRLEELRANAAKGKIDDGSSEQPDLELGKAKTVSSLSSSDSDGFLVDFFNEVNSIKSAMNAIRRNIGHIRSIVQEAVLSVGEKEDSKISELQTVIDSSKGLAADVRQRLKVMKESNEKFSHQKNSSPTETRIRDNMLNTLTVKFVDLITDFDEVQREFSNNKREKFERQCRIVYNDITEEQIQKTIDNGVTQVFAAHIVDTELHSKAKAALDYIKNKHVQIKRLEENINELHQLFLDMAIVVQSQGELIDKIEYNCRQAQNYTAKAVVELSHAKKSQKIGRKLMCAAICVAIIILNVILWPILTKFVFSTDS